MTFTEDAPAMERIVGVPLSKTSGADVAVYESARRFADTPPGISRLPPKILVDRVSGGAYNPNSLGGNRQG